MATHVGIVACSPPGAALCFEALSNGASVLANGAQSHFEISMHSHTLSDYMRAIDAGDWGGVAEAAVNSQTAISGVAPSNVFV
jgi:aspartate racemase